MVSPVNISCLARVGPSRIRPHRGGRAAPHARGHVADARVLGHQQQIAAQRDVAAARDRRAVHLGDGGLGAAPQRHEVVGVALHVGVVVHRVPRRVALAGRVVALPSRPGRHRRRGRSRRRSPLPAPSTTITCTSSSAWAHSTAARSSRRRLLADGVEPLGPVEHQGRDARVLAGPCRSGRFRRLASGLSPCVRVVLLLQHRHPRAGKSCKPFRRLPHHPAESGTPRPCPAAAPAGCRCRAAEECASRSPGPARRCSRCRLRDPLMNTGRMNRAGCSSPGMPGPVSAHLNRHACVLGTQLHHDFAAFGRVADGVVEQVGQHALDHAEVGRHHRQARRDVGLRGVGAAPRQPARTSGTRPAPDRRVRSFPSRA